MSCRFRTRPSLTLASLALAASLLPSLAASAQGIRLGSGLNINLGSGGSARRGVSPGLRSQAFDTLYRGTSNRGTSNRGARLRGNSVPSSASFGPAGIGGVGPARGRGVTPVGLARMVQATTGLSIGGPVRTSPARGGAVCILNPHPMPPGPADRVVVSAPGAPPTPEQERTPEEQAREHVLAARTAFEKLDYAGALADMDAAVALVPENRDARQFRSLILFAMRDYKPAAAEAYEAILQGPIWTWETVRDLYPNKDRYSEHYRRLQKDAKTHPEAMETQFLLAYHHLVLGHLAAGEKQLRRVLEIRPEEPVTRQLLEVVVSLQAQPETQAVSTP